MKADGSGHKLSVRESMSEPNPSQRPAGVAVALPVTLEPKCRMEQPLDK